MGDYTLDTKEVDNLLKNLELTVGDMLAIEKPMAAEVITIQKTEVPVDTGATKTSIGQDIIVQTAVNVTDHVGPKTWYAPLIEYGIPERPSYPIQPFVQPSIFGREKTVIRAAQTAFADLLMKKAKSK